MLGDFYSHKMGIIIILKITPVLTWKSQLASPCLVSFTPTPAPLFTVDIYFPKVALTFFFSKLPFLNHTVILKKSNILRIWQMSRQWHWDQEMKTTLEQQGQTNVVIKVHRVARVRNDLVAKQRQQGQNQSDAITLYSGVTHAVCIQSRSLYFRNPEPFWLCSCRVWGSEEKILLSLLDASLVFAGSFSIIVRW